MRVLIALLLLTPLGCVSEPRAWKTPGVHAGELRVADRVRSFTLHVPKQVGQRPLPLVVLLHGGGGVGSKMARFSGFDAVAAREGFLLVCPQGVGRQWNDGRTIPQSDAHRDQVPDVAFLTGLIGLLRQHLPVDGRRIYVTGVSNGAAMTFRLIAEATSLFAAAAPVINAMPTAVHARAQPQGPLPLLIIAGEQDPLIPYDGGEIRLWGKSRGAVLGFLATARFWAKHNGCQTQTELPVLDRDPEDGTRVRRTVWSGGRAPVELWTIEGGGHTWPGGSTFLEWLVDGTIGVESKELDAAEVIWTFFERHARSTP